MAFTLETAIPELRKAVPAFPIDEEWERDNSSYLVFGDFARFICSEAEVLQYATSEQEARSLSHVPVCMEFLERALAESDADGRDMILDSIETLSSSQWERQIKRWAGPQVSAAWGFHSSNSAISGR
jgi:hypothetical protein